MKKNKHIKKTVITALFTAIICIAAVIVKFPVPGMINGYCNLGDAFILIAAYFCGAGYGAAAAGIGSLIADLISGFGEYAPATLIIKGFMALIFTAVALLPAKKIPKLKPLWLIIGAVTTEAVMIGGYFVFEWGLFGIAAATASLMGNTVQGICSVVIGVVLITLLSENKTINELTNGE